MLKIRWHEHPDRELFTMVTALTVRWNGVECFLTEVFREHEEMLYPRALLWIDRWSRCTMAVSHWSPQKCSFTFLLAGPCSKPATISSARLGTTDSGTAARRYRACLLSSWTRLGLTFLHHWRWDLVVAEAREDPCVSNSVTAECFNSILNVKVTSSANKTCRKLRKYWGAAGQDKSVV